MAYLDYIRKADKWTIMDAVGGQVAGFLSDTYWIGSTIDAFFNLKSETFVALSHYGLGIGIALALLTSTGATISDFAVSVRHQTNVPARAAGPAHSFLEAYSKVYLSQRLALLGKWISYTGDIAGPITMTISLVLLISKEQIPHWTRGLVYGSATIFGAASAVAKVRVACNNMLAENQEIEAAARPLLRFTH